MTRTDKRHTPDMGRWKTLKELDPGLYRLRMEHKVGVAVHYFCNECDYHDRKYFKVAYSLAEKLTRPIVVPHGEHDSPRGDELKFSD